MMKNFFEIKYMRSLITLLSILFMVSCSTITSHSGTLHGKVQGGKNNKGIPNVWVNLMEEPDRTFSLVPLSSRVVGATKTNEQGEFVFEVPIGIIFDRLYFIANGKQIIKKIDSGAYEMRSTDIRFDKLSAKRINVIIVPEDFSPSEKHIDLLN